MKIQIGLNVTEVDKYVKYSLKSIRETRQSNNLMCFISDSFRHLKLEIALVIPASNDEK